MKKTNQSANMTSFHDHVVTATVNQLLSICGEPEYVNDDISDKVQYDWVMETEDGKVFTIYDWKEYRHFSKDEKIEWHIGAHDSYTALTAYLELKKELANC